MNFSIDVFRDMLPINKHDLDTELERQADVMEKISRTVAKKNTETIKAKDRLARVESELIAEAKEANPKLAATFAEADVKTNRRRTQAWEEYQEAREQHEEWTGLLAAWTARGYNLKPLAQLYTDQYFTVDSITSPRPSQDALRSRMREAADRKSNERAETIPRRRPTT